MQVTMTVGIYDVELSACIGLLRQEKEIAQTYRLTVEATYSVNEHHSDSSTVALQISYVDIFDIVHSSFDRGGDLLEEKAIEISEKLESRFPFIHSIRIEILKLNPPIKGIVGNAGIKYFFEK